MVVEFEGGQVDPAEDEKRRAHERRFEREGIRLAEVIEADPSEKDMDEIVQLEGREQREDEIEEGGRIEDCVLRVRQERLAVAVGVGPEGEIPFPEELGADLPGRDLEQRRVAFEEDAVREEKFLEHPQEDDKEKKDKRQVFFGAKADIISGLKHDSNFYQKMGLFSNVGIYYNEKN